MFIDVSDDTDSSPVNTSRTHPRIKKLSPRTLLDGNKNIEENGPKRRNTVSYTILFALVKTSLCPKFLSVIMHYLCLTMKILVQASHSQDTLWDSLCHKPRPQRMMTKQQNKPLVCIYIFPVNGKYLITKYFFVVVFHIVILIEFFQTREKAVGKTHNNWKVRIVNTSFFCKILYIVSCVQI